MPASEVTTMEQQRQQRTGRPCLVCSNRERYQVESALIIDPLSSVSRRFQIGRDALRRHARSHMTVTMKSAYLAAQGLDQVSLIQEVADAIEQQKLIASEAKESGQLGVASRAVSASLRAVELLATMRVGSTAEADQIGRMSDFLTASVRAARLDPAHADAIAEQIEKMGNSVLLEEFRDMVPETEKYALEATR